MPIKNIKTRFAISIIRPAIALLLVLFSLWSAQSAFAGSIVAWRDNYIPSPNTGFIAVAAGYGHSLGLKQDGSIVAWGSNNHGQCNIPSPNSGFIAIAAGGWHSLGLKQDGSIVGWGYNYWGQRNSPSPNSGFIAIAAGWDHSLGLKQDGSIVAWGYNQFGQCNIPSPNTGFIAIAAGGDHSLGLKQDGSIVARGYNNYGQCNIPSPNSGFIAIAAGSEHSLGLKQYGSIVAWGWNNYGQCNIPSPNSGFIAIAAGGWHSLGLKQDGSIVAWGDNSSGQCNIPSPNSGFIAISAGTSHSLALKAEEGTTGTFIGTVLDQETSLPIKDAEVFVSRLPYLKDVSKINGQYAISTVPYNTLFTLVVSASGYKTSYTNDLQVTEANPFKTIDISLTPSPWQSLKLIELNPNPNSNPMKIMRGGTGHRYYQIVDENNVSRNGISVTTNPALHGPFFSKGTIREGIVSIDVDSMEVTNDQTITVTHLNGIPIDPGPNNSFVVHIVPQKQTKTWEIRTAAELGVSNVQGEKEGALEISIQDNESSDAVPETISISRKALAGIGVSQSAKIAGYCQILNFEGGLRAEAGISGTHGGSFQDRFSCDYDTSNSDENLAKLYLLLYPAPLLSPILGNIQNALESPLLATYEEEVKAGIYVKRAAWAKGNLAIIPKSITSNNKLALAGNVMGNVQGTISFASRKNSNFSIVLELEVDGGLHGQAQAGFDIQTLLGPVSATILEPIKYTKAALICVRFEEIFEPGGKLTEIKIAIRLKSDGSSLPYNVVGEEIEWSLSGPSERLISFTMTTPQGVLKLLRESIHSTEPKVVEPTMEGIVKEIDNLFLQAGPYADLTITCERRLLLSRVVDKPIFNLDIGGTAELELDLGVGVNSQFSETRELVVERSRVINIYEYPTESYLKEDYALIDVTLANIYAKGLKDVLPTIQSIFDNVQKIVEAGKEFTLNAGNSALQIGADVLEAGQKIVNVFGVQTGQKMMALAADSNMPVENKYFGFGGIYQLEPNDLKLPQPGTFTITYLDDELTGYDESALSMYRWDKSTGKWKFVGGTVDTATNSVSASIERLGVYTLGSRVEYGNFIFTSDPNTASADGNSIIHFTSEQILNNDETQVADETLFTVSVSGGTMTTPDTNALLEGIQVATQGGILQFDLKAPQIAIEAKAEAVSLNRMATVTGNVTFTDSNAPQAPTGVKVKIGQGKIFLSWDKNTEIDLAGYKIYFDDDQNGPPYNGVANYSGQNSPIDVADANSHFLRGLQSGHTYYVTLTAYDVPGNESPFGSEVVFLNTLPPDSDSDGMPDSWEVKYANAANGLLPTANDSMLDNDGDGLTNSEEYMTDNDPINPDSDEDGVEDSVDMCQTNSRPGLSVDANGCAVGDFDSDGRIGPPDLSRVIAHWLDADCNEPDWCEGTDFDLSTNVNFTDFSDFARAWSLELLEPVMGDFNRNRFVDIGDLAIFAGQWLQICTGPSWCDRCDIDKSSFVDFADFTQSAEHWLEGISH